MRVWRFEGFEKGLPSRRWMGVLFLPQGQKIGEVAHAFEGYFLLNSGYREPHLCPKLFLMKIVQSFWSGGQTEVSPLHNRAGWLSAEYHWMSWALSSLQFNKFYDHVSLVTDEAGKAVLYETLKLPYSSVDTQLDALNRYSGKLWALGKIYAYSIQREPFIHADGDVYIWQKFDRRLETAGLIGQNLEVDFVYYYQSMGEVEAHFEYVPEAIQLQTARSRPWRSCNTGVIGGHRLDIFAEYCRTSLDFIERNAAHLGKIDLPTFNIVFEQLLYYSLAQYRDVGIEYLIEPDQPIDTEYRGFARFECVPYGTKFIHALGDFKRTPETCRHLARRLRQDYPAAYYRVLRECLSAGVSLDSRAYDCPELNPLIQPHEVFAGYLRAYRENDGAFWKTCLDRVLRSDGTAVPAAYLYAKDTATYGAVQRLFALFATNSEAFSRQVLCLDSDARLEEQFVPTYTATLRAFDAYDMAEHAYTLDPLDAVLMDVFQQPAPIEEALKAARLYFPLDQAANSPEALNLLVADRLKQLIYRGGLQWLENQEFATFQATEAALQCV